MLSFNILIFSDTEFVLGMVVPSNPQYHIKRGRPDQHVYPFHTEVKFVSCMVVPNNMQHHLKRRRPDQHANTSLIFSHSIHVRPEQYAKVTVFQYF